jgi:hypothetical protein
MTLAVMRESVVCRGVSVGVKKFIVKKKKKGGSEKEGGRAKRGGTGIEMSLTVAAYPNNLQMNRQKAESEAPDRYRDKSGTQTRRRRDYVSSLDLFPPTKRPTSAQGPRRHTCMFLSSDVCNT